MPLDELVFLRESIKREMQQLEELIDTVSGQYNAENPPTMDVLLVLSLHQFGGIVQKYGTEVKRRMEIYAEGKTKWQPPTST